jgi:hypothetical protein
MHKSVISVKYFVLVFSPMLSEKALKINNVLTHGNDKIFSYIFFCFLCLRKKMVEHLRFELFTEFLNDVNNIVI